AENFVAQLPADVCSSRFPFLDMIRRMVRESLQQSFTLSRGISWRIEERQRHLTGTGPCGPPAFGCPQSSPGQNVARETAQIFRLLDFMFWFGDRFAIPFMFEPARHPTVHCLAHRLVIIVRGVK